MATKEELRLALARGVSAGLDQFFRTCIEALGHDLAPEIIASAAPLTAGVCQNEASIWQVLGLAHRALQDCAAAHEAFTRALALAPSDKLVAHSRARTAMEAGFPAAGQFGQALALTPDDPALVQGRAAALLAEGERDQAIEELAARLDRVPDWLEGHRALAKIRAMSGSNREALSSLRCALQRDPKSFALWATMIGIALHADDYLLARECVDEARAALGSHPEFDRIEAISLSETGQPEAAQQIFASLPHVARASVVIHPLRNLIRLRRFEEAARLAEQRLPGDEDFALWPYRALLWRLLGDQRWEALEGDPRLIASYNLKQEIGPIDELAALLRELHRLVGRPIDQSVRGGSQTDGNLVARAEPAIRRLRGALLDAVEDYVARLPKAQPGHPTLIPVRAPLQFQGSWSVLLRGAGFHVDHVHPQGWISSALYIALPEGVGGIASPMQDEAGWLKFGEAQTLVPELKAFRAERPEVGKLVLFPSTTWHGTRPFGRGERISVAFDIARPRQ